MLRGAVFGLCNLWMGMASKPPNILWIMADDMGWGEPGLYPCTSPHGRIATPNLDSFGEQALKFTNSYAGYTVCAPSRTTLFTARHSGQFVKHNLSGTGIDPGQNVITLSSLLQKSGYSTGLFGKSAPLNDPLGLGFDAFWGQVLQHLARMPWLCFPLVPNPILCLCFAFPDSAFCGQTSRLFFCFFCR